MNLSDVFYHKQLTQQHLTNVSTDSKLYATNNILCDQYA